MRFQTTLIAVADTERSKAFYETLFGQKVVCDLGWNVTFSGGFTIQKNFGWLIDKPESEVQHKSHNMELYFEVGDFDAFLQRLAQYPSVEYVHPPKMHEWKQRVVRIYDPDGHIIEVGEAMRNIAMRYLMEGKTAQEVAELIQHPIEFVEAVRDGKLPLEED